VYYNSTLLNVRGPRRALSAGSYKRCYDDQPTWPLSSRVDVADESFIGDGLSLSQIAAYTNGGETLTRSCPHAAVLRIAQSVFLFSSSAEMARLPASERVQVIRHPVICSEGPLQRHGAPIAWLSCCGCIILKEASSKLLGIWSGGMYS
jgi:hypothetical protein